MAVSIAATTTYEYDALGRLKTVTRSDGTTVTYTLDAAGNRERVLTEIQDTTAPSVPTGVTASATAWNRVKVSWAVSSDNFNGAGVSGYVVYRDGQQVATTSVVSSYTDTTVSGSRTYSYRVAAFDGAIPRNTSSQSDPAVTVTTPAAPDTTPPSVPGGLNASAPTSNRVDLSWTSSTDTGGSGLAGYRVYRAIPPSALSLFATLPGPGTTFSDTSVSGTTNYSYAVGAYDGAGNSSAQSAAVSITTPDTIAPGAPSGLTATAVSPTQVNLAWTASSDGGGSGLAGYRIYRDGVHLANAGTNSYSNSGLQPATPYQYAVAAYDNASNQSGMSNTASVSTPGYTAAITMYQGLHNAGPVVKMYGYNSGYMGSLSPTGFAGKTVTQFYDNKANNAFQHTRLTIRGFTSDPGAGWVMSVTAHGQTRTGASATSYGYASGTAYWEWSNSFPAIGFVSSGAVTCTFVHR